MAHVLVYQIGALGDTIVSIPSYRAVRRHFGSTEIRLLQAQLQEGRVMPSDMLLREKLIDSVTSYPHNPDGPTSGEKLAIWKTVFKSRPSAVVYIGPAERHPDVVKRDKLFFRLCGVRSLIGFHGIDYASFGPRGADGSLPRLPNQAQMRLTRLEQDGILTKPEDLRVPLLHPTREEKEAVLEWLESNRKAPSKKLVTVGFMTAQEATRWPLERFIELGKRLLAAGNVELCLVGGPGDVEIARLIAEAWGSGLVAAGEFDLHTMGALLAISDLYIGLNTGTTHLASAVGANVLAVYSDHNQPGEWDPLVPGHRLILNRVPCGGCQRPTCSTPGHPCMTGITVDDVFDAAIEGLGE